MLLPVVQTDEQRYPVGLATEYSHHTMTKRILARSLAESYGLFANFTWLVGIGVWYDMLLFLEYGVPY